MSIRDYWRFLQCLFRGHSWLTYFYPRNDGWFSGSHWRRECSRCGQDEATL